MSMRSLTPHWPAPANIKAATTLRSLGNVAAHVGEDPAIVAQNRACLIQEFNLPKEPYWLNQTHSDKVIQIDVNTPLTLQDADGSYTQLPNTVCSVLTADCLPILMCDKHGQEIAALHAGWKGILVNIIESGLQCFKSSPSDILVWFGPAIGPQAFEVGPEVLEAFAGADPENKQAFIPSHRPNHYFLDIYQLARLYFNRLGVTQLYGGTECTYSDPQRFYSYRRENQTGRMVSFIWRT